GEHSFAIRHEVGGAPGADIINAVACGQCHTLGVTSSPRGQEFDVVARDDYDGDGTTSIIQLEVTGLLHQLGGVTTTAADNPYGIVPVAQGLLLQLASAMRSEITPALAASDVITAVYSSHGGIKIQVTNASGVTRDASIPASARGTTLYKAAWN